MENDEELRSSKESNRKEQIRCILEAQNSRLENIREVLLDGVSYKVQVGSGSILSIQDTENIFLLAKLFEKGYKPKAIGAINPDQIYVHVLTLEGEFTRLPSVSKKSEIILKHGDTYRDILIEKPVTLEVGKDYTEKIYFDVEGKKHWIFINSVQPYNILEKMVEQFQDPRYLEHYTQEALNEIVQDITKNIKESCPEGKCFILVEYESNNDESIRLFSKDWLDRIPSRSNHCTAFFVRPDSDKPLGKLGRSLKVELIAEPFEQDIKSIEAEIFSSFKRVPHPDIKI